MKQLFLFAFLGLGLSCAGGGISAPPPTPYSLSWDKSSYTVTTAADSTTTIQVIATVTAHGSNLPGIIGVGITPSGQGINPTPGNGPWQTSVGTSIPVTFYVAAPAGPGSYPKGSHPFTATWLVGGQSYTASMNVTVQ